MAIIFEALVMMFSMCLTHLPLLLRVKPRCLWSVTKLIGIPSKKSCGKLNMRFRVHSIPSIFRGLKFTSHCLAHADRICKSWLIILCKSRIEEQGAIVCKRSESATCISLT